jgi:alpha-beta hydrolase superfamily lysophospholipase
LADAGQIASFTAGDGYRWHYRRFTPPGPPRARVVYLHGIQSHGGWYQGSCTRLAAAGFLVDFLDRRGSGLNQQARGHAPSYRRLLDDLAEFLLATPTRPRVPTFLVGISWGGKLALALPCYRPGLVDGVALLCPGLFPRLDPRLRRRQSLLLFLESIVPRHRHPIPLNDPTLFTASPQWQQFLRDDPLALHRATIRFLAASLHLDRYLRYLPRRFHLPVLLLLAEKDRILDNAATRRYMERLATPDRTILEYGEAHHTLEFEPEPQRFIDDLIRWLGEHADRETATP